MERDIFLAASSFLGPGYDFCFSPFGSMAATTVHLAPGIDPSVPFWIEGPRGAFSETTCLDSQRWMSFGHVGSSGSWCFLWGGNGTVPPPLSFPCPDEMLIGAPDVVP
eukprot:scaffold585_cov330-Pavlova_lutheri.AAC.24